MEIEPEELDKLMAAVGAAKGEAHGWWTRAFVAEERLIWALGELRRARDLLSQMVAVSHLQGPVLDHAVKLAAEFLVEVTDGSTSGIPKRRRADGPGQSETLPPGT